MCVTTAIVFIGFGVITMRQQHTISVAVIYIWYLLGQCTQTSTEWVTDHQHLMITRYSGSTNVTLELEWLFILENEPSVINWYFGAVPVMNKVITLPANPLNGYDVEYVTTGNPCGNYTYPGCIRIKHTTETAGNYSIQVIGSTPLSGTAQFQLRDNQDAGPRITNNTYEVYEGEETLVVIDDERKGNIAPQSTLKIKHGNEQPLPHIRMRPAESSWEDCTPNGDSTSCDLTQLKTNLVYIEWNYDDFNSPNFNMEVTVKVPEDKRCVDRLACIVPATVVPICVCLAVGLGVGLGLKNKK